MAYLTWKTSPDQNRPTDLFTRLNDGSQKPAEGAAEAAMEFDATLLEDYTRAADITEFPVEEGADISDHMQPRQPAITLEVFVSDTPTEVPTTFADSSGSIRPTPLELRQYPPQAISLPTSARFFRNVSNLGRVLIPNKGTKGPGASSANVLVFDGRLNRIVNIFTELNRHMTEKTKLSVVLAASKFFAPAEQAFTFDNMLISNIQAPRRSQDGTGLVFIIDLKQVRIASRDVGEFQAAPEQNRGVEEKGKGRQNATKEQQEIMQERLRNTPGDAPVHPVFQHIGL